MTILTVTLNIRLLLLLLLSSSPSSSLTQFSFIKVPTYQAKGQSANQHNTITKQITHINTPKQHNKTTNKTGRTLN